MSKPPATKLPAALTSLINELVALARETTLVLDDYHLISDPVIHDSLQFLLDHRPLCLQLVVASRGDPPLPYRQSWAFRHMVLKHAHSRAELERMVAVSRFGKGEILRDGISFDLRLAK